MKPKQIAVITFSLSNNGAERVFTELSNEWARKGHSVTVIQFEKDAFGSESFELDPRVSTITLGHKNITHKVARYFMYLYEIRRYLKNHQDAAVIAFSFTTQVIVAVASLFLKNQIVFSERNDPNRCPYSSLTRELRNISFYKADKIVFQTEDAKKYFPESIRRRGTIISNPITPLLPEMFDGERRKVIITASRLRPQKNLSMLIEAFAMFHSSYPEYEVEIYGIGEELKMLEQLAIDRGIANQVHFMGFSSDVNMKMCDAAMYVCSSDYEGISNSMLEALGMGVPTISTDCPIGGARQIIKDHENGILVPVRDTHALYRAMIEIAGNKELASKLSGNGYLVRDEYKVDRIAMQWVNYFDEN